MQIVLALVLLILAGLTGWLRFFTRKGVFADDPTVVVLSGGARWPTPVVQLPDYPQSGVLFSDENGLPLEGLYDFILAQGHWVALALLVIAVVLFVMAGRAG